MQINKTVAAGYLFEDPIIRFNAGGDSATIRFKFGVTESWRDRESGQNQEHTERFIAVKHNASAGFADFVKREIRKGTNIYVEGRCRTRKWRPNGADKDQYITEVIINPGIESFQKVGDPKGAAESSQPQQRNHQSQPAQPAHQPAPQMAPSQEPPAYLSEAPPLDFPEDIPSQQGGSGAADQDYFSDLRPPQNQ